FVFCLFLLRPPISTLFPSTTLFRSAVGPAVRSRRRTSGVDDLAPRRHVQPGGLQSGAYSSCPLGATNHRRRRNRACHRLLRFRRSEEHTSELQSRENLVCRLLLEKK